MSSPSLPLPSHALVDEPPKQIPLLRKLLLLLILCFSQMLDSFSMSSVFSALPVLEQSLNLTTSQGVWIISGNQLTFASTLLIVRLVVLCCTEHLPIRIHRADESAMSMALVSLVIIPYINGPNRTIGLPFVGGVTALGLLSLGAGFVNNKLVLIVLRSLSGIGKNTCTT